jgi:hypothetical protein
VLATAAAAWRACKVDQQGEMFPPQELGRRWTSIDAQFDRPKSTAEDHDQGKVPRGVGVVNQRPRA